MGDEKYPDTLEEKARAILAYGRLLLASGAGAYRVKYSMARAAHQLGISRLEASVTMTDITVTAWENGRSQTDFTEQRHVGVNSRRLDVLSEIGTQDLKVRSVSHLRSLLEQTVKQDRHWGMWTTVFAAAFACAAFCFLNGGRVVECTTVFFAAGIGQLVRKLMLKRNYAHFFIWVVCGMVSPLVYMGILSMLASFGHVLQLSHQAGLISAILFLIPGFPLTTAMLDFVRSDFQSALARFSYCVMVLGSAGLPLWAVTHATNWDVVGAAPMALPFALNLSLQILCSFVAAGGFAILFNAAWKVALLAAGVAALTNPTRLILQNYSGIPWQIAVGLAAFVAGLCATFVAWRTTHSRVSLSVPSVVIMIPGVPFYGALVAINEGNLSIALTTIAEVFFVIMAIGFGLAFSRAVTDRGWLHDRDTTKLADSYLEDRAN